MESLGWFIEIYGRLFTRLYVLFTGRVILILDASGLIMLGVRFSSFVVLPTKLNLRPRFRFRLLILSLFILILRLKLIFCFVLRVMALILLAFFKVILLEFQPVKVSINHQLDDLSYQILIFVSFQGELYTILAYQDKILELYIQYV